MSEQTLYQANPEMFRNHPIGFVVVVLLCCVGVGFLILIPWWIACKATRLTVTDKRTILRKGILSKSLNEVWHQDIRNVRLRQSFLQRLFGVGSIGISSAGQSGIEIAAHGMADPGQVKDLIDKHRADAQP